MTIKGQIGGVLINRGKCASTNGNIVMQFDKTEKTAFFWTNCKCSKECGVTQGQNVQNSDVSRIFSRQK